MITDKHILEAIKDRNELAKSLILMKYSSNVNTSLSNIFETCDRYMAYAYKHLEK